MNPSIKFKTTTQFVLGDRSNSSIKRTSQPKIVSSLIALVFWLALSANGQAPPGALWYNGDLDVNVAGQQNAMGFGYNQCVSESNSHIYDDFNVPAGPGWIVTDVFFDNLLELFGSTLSKIDGVLWEIRQGVSDGNPGTLVANGATYINYSVTPTGRSKDGSFCLNPLVNVSLVEYRVMASGLNVFLPPGSYFLNVTPIGSEQCVFYGSDFVEAVGAAFNSGTNGANCVGTPCGNNNLAFINAPDDLGANWEPTTNLDPSSHDFAMGVIGNVLNQSPVLIEGGSLKQGFKIPMPINGESGIEDRSGQPGGAYTITMTFNENIASVAHASASCGKVASTSIDGATLTINLTKVSCNASHITVTANDVKDSAGINLDSACIEVGLLLGDVNGDGVVDSADLDIVNSQIGQPTNGENFRSDINNDGTISTADVRIVTQQQGMRLP
jgi:hypothetical protein